MEWISEEEIIEEITDDVTINIRMAQQRHEVEKKLLTLKDRSILLVRSLERSSADKAYIYDLITKFRAFTKHSENVRENLAAVCFYQYLPSGRVIVRQGHKARNLYFIINGEVNLSKVVIDDLTGEEKVVHMGTIHPGDMFGEVALLHTIPRTSTIITKTSVDLLLITQDDFNNILRSSLTKKWDVLKDALVHFNYFKLWDEETIRECCILSKLKDFKPNEILLGDGKGMVNYVHFILKGKCRLIEHMLVHERSSYHGMQYELYETYDPQLRRVPKKIAESDKLESNQFDKFIPNNFILLYIIFLVLKSVEAQDEVDRLSIVTTTLLDVSQSDHKLIDLHNRANIWGRVKLFLDLKYPTKKQLFNEFLLNRKWMTYKQNLVKDALNRRGHFHSNITIHDVPYSIRITDEIDPKL
ncbi:CNBD2 protein, partial [Acromyrmex charruanus]